MIDVDENIKQLIDGLKISERDNAGLRAALQEVVEYADKYGIHDEGDGHALVNIARAAIENHKGADLGRHGRHL